MKELKKLWEWWKNITQSSILQWCSGFLCSLVPSPLSQKPRWFNYLGWSSKITIWFLLSLYLVNTSLPNLNICGYTGISVSAADAGSQPSLMSSLRWKQSSDLSEDIRVGETEEEGHRHSLGGGCKRGHDLCRKILYVWNILLVRNIDLIFSYVNLKNLCPSNFSKLLSTVWSLRDLEKWQGRFIRRISSGKYCMLKIGAIY